MSSVRKSVRVGQGLRTPPCRMEQSLAVGQRSRGTAAEKRTGAQPSPSIGQTRFVIPAQP
jgi:hypothetical protein